MTPSSITPPWLRDALRVLAGGGAVAIATESFFALAVDARSPQAIDVLFRIKQRDLGKGIGLMVPLASWRTVVTGVSPTAELLAEEFWPGPLSLVLPANADLDPRLVVDGCVSLRVPGSSLAAVLTEAWSGPLTATSANLTGQLPCTTEEAVREQFSASNTDLYVAPGSCPGGLPSTLVQVVGDQWKVLRQGAIAEPLLGERLATARRAASSE